MSLADRAEALFMEGYNCSQAVFGAVAPEYGMDFETAMKIASSLGGGMGRLREVCGACSGAFMAAGLIKGYSTPEKGSVKADHYALIRKMADEFAAVHGSIVCREILGKNAEVGGTPEARSPEYYAKRPCVRCIRTAAEIVEREIAGQNE